jgi:hypothetical protein
MFGSGNVRRGFAEICDAAMRCDLPDYGFMI